MPDETSLIRTRPRIGLALGAGVARGWAHIGVLRGLKRLGIEPDIVTGTSVGALVGARTSPAISTRWRSGRAISAA